MRDDQKPEPYIRRTFDPPDDKPRFVGPHASRDIPGQRIAFTAKSRFAVYAAILTIGTLVGTAIYEVVKTNQNPINTMLDKAGKSVGVQDKKPERPTSPSWWPWQNTGPAPK